MKGPRLSKRLLSSTTALLFSAGLAMAAGEQADHLTEAHREWLEEEVVYIITDEEKQLFLTLETVEERNRFIEAFWKRRDPEPATPQNEFREEHYRRWEYANATFARQTFKPGWKTDQGRIYIILGEPRQREKFEAYFNVAYTELWTYQASPSSGLPPFFFVLFFKRHDVGEYRLYSPLADGPLSLIRGQDHYTNDPTEAIEELLDVSPNLAHASLTFDMSENPDFRFGRPSLGSELIVARIADVPKRAVRTDYVDAWRRYGRSVSAEYSFNFVPSRSAFAVLLGPDETPFVHYRVEVDPQNFSLIGQEDESRYFTTLDISLEVTNRDGVRLLAREKEVYIELSPSELQEFNASPFAYQDDFPLIPGDYEVTVILRNRASSQYTVAERELVVGSPPTGRPGLTDVVLGYETVQAADDAGAGEMRAFQVGQERVFPAADGVFYSGETAHAFFQVLGEPSAHELRYLLSLDEEVLEDRTLPVERHYPEPVQEDFALTNAVGGSYELRVQLVDGEGRIVDEKSMVLNVSPRAAMPRAWVHSRSFDTRVPGALALARGEQLSALERHEAAARELGAAVLANPELAEARWRLAGIYLGWQEPDEVIALLLPIEEEYAEQYEVIAGLGFAFYMKEDIASALSYFERASALRPPGTSLLNALADCHERSGNTDRARELLQRSLDLDPDQQPIRDRLGTLGG